MRKWIDIVESSRFSQTDPASVPIDSEWRQHRDDSYLARFETPKLIGPHARRELNLMLAGTKPMAFAEAPLEPLFQKVAREQGWVSRKIPFINPHKRFWVFALPGQEWRIDAAEKIYTEVRRKGKMDLRDHARLGLLLGYSKDAIREFLQRRRADLN